MPYARPTLSAQRSRVASDIQSALSGSDPLLRFSALNIIGTALAGLSYEHYGYEDWIARMANPFTAEGEFLEAWAALKRVYRLAATQAGYEVPGQITFQGTNGYSIPAGAAIARGDGVAYTVTTGGTVAGNSVTVSAIANADPTGLTGAFGNCPVNTVMTLGVSIAGIQSTGAVTLAFQGGTDVETDDSLRVRMLQAYQNLPQGGAQGDYVTWALAVPGVTRAWCNPSGFGAGTVVVYTMLDVVEAAFNGFPQGINGVATGETRGSPTAAGDQLLVANAIYPLRPATALVYSVSPIAAPVNFTISGLATASASLKAEINLTIAGILVLYGSPISTTPGQNGSIDLSYINSAIAALSGTAGFVLTSPTTNIVGTTGQLPTLGTVTFV
jgi:uncharacterized phage protein gp47/JayE